MITAFHLSAFTLKACSNLPRLKKGMGTLLVPIPREFLAGLPSGSKSNRQVGLLQAHFLAMLLALSRPG